MTKVDIPSQILKYTGEMGIQRSYWGAGDKMKIIKLIVSLFVVAILFSSCSETSRNSAPSQENLNAQAATWLPVALTRPVVSSVERDGLKLTHRQLNEKTEFAVSISPVESDQAADLMIQAAETYVRDDVCPNYAALVAAKGKTLIPAVYYRAPIPPVYDESTKTLSFLGQCALIL